jgi:BirA family transcriptional regulator, biotin operon repressor / biotin---[acetyl-CoA-carboxylase] ligase
MLPLIHLPTVDSTQAFLGRHPELGFCGVLADTQTDGRGRGENRWESPAGAGLWFSARLPLPELPLGIVSQRAMAAVTEALAPWAPELGLKWPNDLVAYLDGRLRKLGGILGEVRQGVLILGVGVNLSGAPTILDRAIPPACLADLGPVPLPERTDLARDLLHRWQDLGAAADPAFLWPGAGTAIRWEGGTGICQGWEPDGRLRVAVKDHILRLTAGDIVGLADG